MNETIYTFLFSGIPHNDQIICLTLQQSALPYTGVVKISPAKYGLHQSVKETKENSPTSFLDSLASDQPFCVCILLL